ncbi:MAG: hypothetical protein PVF17_08400 [Ignavibacteria bacterium]|jgi:hypothetical protein
MFLIESEDDVIKQFDTLILDNPSNFQRINIKRFSGESDITQLIIILSASLIPSLTKILLEIIRSRKHISFKVKGLEIKGITEKNLEKFLLNLLKKEDKNND